MKEPNDHLISWLRDAHAMESNIVDMLQTQAKHLENYPELQKRVAQHAAESKRHAQAVEECLQHLGSDTSALKEGMAKLSGILGSGAMGLATDDAVKMTLGDIATEHFEIASYESLRAGAALCGNQEVVQLADRILAEERAMAEFLEDCLDDVTEAFLERES